MIDNLYFIANSGCDATTYGLARISDEDFSKFKTIVENLNKNSYYGCMPTISVYKISERDIKEIQHNPNAEPWDDDYVDKDYIFYLDGKTYTFSKQYFSYYTDLEIVINPDERSDTE